jgi:flavin-dependent dehydrogenase
MRPVTIAGAGPAGLCAALLLGRSGVRVLVREKRADVGQRFRGAVHGLENWSSLEPFSERLSGWGVELGATSTPCHELWLCDGRSLRTIRSPEPLFYLVRRGSDADSLEGRLLRLARDAGAEIRLGETFAPGSADFDATGPVSTRRVCTEMGIHFVTRAPDLAAALVTHEATPSGYAYLLVRSGVGSLCAVRFDGQPVRREQLALCERLLLRHVPLDVREAKPGAGFGSFSLLGCFGGAGGWAIGESAGIQDMLWGFGIRRALESAALAARCWLDGAPYPAVAARELGVPDRAALVNRCIWDTTAARALPAYAHLLRRQGNIRAALFRATRGGLLHSALYPLALWRMRRRFPHLSELEGADPHRTTGPGEPAPASWRNTTTCAVPSRTRR